jgi:hypothetical protein
MRSVVFSLTPLATAKLKRTGKAGCPAEFHRANGARLGTGKLSQERADQPAPSGLNRYHHRAGKKGVMHASPTKARGVRPLQPSLEASTCGSREAHTNKQTMRDGQPYLVSQGVEVGIA